MLILITGDRNWTDEHTIYSALVENAEPGRTTVLHGGARGADTLSGHAAISLGLQVEVERAQWGRYGRAAGPIRNNLMLDRAPDLVLAFHPNITESKGTKHCVTEALRQGLPVLLYDGAGHVTNMGAGK